MTFIQRIPLKYLIYIPSAYFALLGAYDIISDILNGGIKTENLLFNLIFFLPLVFRRWYILLSCGVVFGVFWIWQFTVGSFLLMDAGTSYGNVWRSLALWLFLLASMLCSFMLYHAGSRLKASLGITHRIN
ncbi:MAG TPA: hypothetical protein VEB40_03045 [Flavipsychrobacter sp.]|nr:hypothetical protein [Flavipsychrobacter sp.]